jgi:hypothetical protein
MLDKILPNGACVQGLKLAKGQRSRQQEEEVVSRLLVQVGGVPGVVEWTGIGRGGVRACVRACVCACVSWRPAQELVQVRMVHVWARVVGGSTSSVLEGGAVSAAAAGICGNFRPTLVGHMKGTCYSLPWGIHPQLLWLLPPVSLIPTQIGSL